MKILESYPEETVVIKNVEILTITIYVALINF